MKNICTAAGLAAVVAVVCVSPVWAEDADKPMTVTIDNYANFDNSGGLVTDHELDFVLEGKAGDWTVGAEAWVGIERDWVASTTTFEIPTLELSATSDKFGGIYFWDTDPALEAACITPTPGSTHFGTEDLMTIGTCTSYEGQAIRYVTPDFFDGFGLQVSAMKDVENLTDVGDVDSAVSAALTYTHTANDVTFSADLGVDAALSVNGGLPAGTPLPVTVQGGTSVEWDGWTVAAAGQYEFASLAGGNSWGVGAGVSRAVTETLTLGTEVAYDHYEDTGVKLQELSLGATGEYQFIDNASIDGAFNVVHRTGDDGTDEVAAQIGTGISVSF